MKDLPGMWDESDITGGETDCEHKYLEVKRYTPLSAGDHIPTMSLCDYGKWMKVSQHSRIIATLKAQSSGVVLPEHRNSDLRSPAHEHSKGWNACLDEVARLNHPASAGDERAAGTKVSDTSINCWSCKLSVLLDERADADGNCPHCRVELDLEEYLRAALSAKHSERVRGVIVPPGLFDQAISWIEDRRRYGDEGTLHQVWYDLKTIQREWRIAAPSAGSQEQGE